MESWDLKLSNIMHLNLSDNINIKEKHNLDNMGLIGEVEFRNKETGEIIFKKKNTILVGGKTFVLSKIFNIDTRPIKRITLNEIYNHNVNEDPYDYVGPRREKQVCLFGVGIGGSDITIGSAYAPNPREYNLYEQIPIRYVDKNEDLDDEEKKNYYLRILDNNNDKISYYLKRFDKIPTLIRKAGAVDFVPNLNDNQRIDDPAHIINRTAVDVYVEMKFTISAKDVREYFIAKNNIKMSRINEICLYSAYQPLDAGLAYTEYRGIEAFSKITFDNEVLNNYTKVIEVTYRIYC